VPNAVVVPTSAVTLDATNGGAGTVMVVDAQSVAHEVHVTTGAHTRERTQIVSGLHGGETVVIEGNYGLPDGTKVQIDGSPVSFAPLPACGERVAEGRVRGATRHDLGRSAPHPALRATFSPQAGRRATA
jgi:multidrug efflux system membrane fusion protein